MDRLIDERKPVFLDEFEKLPQNYLGIIRELTETTGVPFVLIGEEELLAYMRRDERGLVPDLSANRVSADHRERHHPLCGRSGKDQVVVSGGEDPARRVGRRLPHCAAGPAEAGLLCELHPDAGHHRGDGAGGGQGRAARG